MKNIMENKIVKIAMTTIRVILITLFVLFMLMICLQRFSGNKIAIFNIRMFTVASGSMAPKYNIGDVLVSKAVKPEKVKVGNTISYLGMKGELKDKVITHQVMEIEKDSEGKILFHTKGICSDCMIEDPIVHQDQLYGVVVYKIRTLSFIYKIIGTKLGLFFCVILPMLYIITSEVIEFLLDKEEKRRTSK